MHTACPCLLRLFVPKMLIWLGFVNLRFNYGSQYIQRQCAEVMSLKTVVPSLRAEMVTEN